MYQRTPVPTSIIASATNDATEKQIAFIKSLKADKDLKPEHLDWLNRHLVEGMTRRRASDIIERLLALPRKAEAVEPEPTIPNGRYAIRVPDDDLNPIHFFKVKMGRTRLFVDRYSSDTLYPVREPKRSAVLSEIGADPYAAAKLYGDEKEACCCCGRGLTRRLSRELRIGPICGAKAGWLTEAMIEDAKATIVAAGFDPNETISSE